MAFAFELDDFRRLDVTEDGSLASITRIGADPDEGTIYTLTVTLDIGIGFTGHEFRFWISEIHPTGVSTDIFSGLETWFLKAGAREAVLRSVLSDITYLLALPKPENVVLLAASPDLPPKAIVKYKRVYAQFTALGYDVQELEPQGGFRGWHFALR